MERIRVGIVDGSPVILMGLAALLGAQPDMHVAVAETTVDRVAEAGPPLDVVLLEADPGGGAALRAAVRRLARRDARVVAVAARPGAGWGREVRAAGAVALVHKRDEPSAIVHVVREAARAGRDRSRPPRRRAGLTGREAEVLALYAAGRTAGEVAVLLYISRETVHDHIRRIRAKYAAAERAAPTKVDLFRRAVEDGLIDDRGHALADG
ncbi:LuxR C-terminal-related transcriptional regulator [Microbacterium sp. No. 7]|uniref:LuxR C-terminal-related transcriptional regulator n=1 Tax=Microbacterium sp. No. 7 TaxID=1714373 RepID=UPI0006D14792|nr:LuxR C-terminal-related transcriptional regulator [Microbacterium sp. No. 7]